MVRAVKLTGLIFMLLLQVCFFSSGVSAEDGATMSDMSLEDLLKLPISYGFDKSPVAIHVFMNGAYWEFQRQALGTYADTGTNGSATAAPDAPVSGYPTFMTYSAYVDIMCQVNKNISGEVEFEMYKGRNPGGFKITKVKQTWTPNEYFRMAIGRDFPPIGVQDKVYYPPSQFRTFSFSPYLYWDVLRATGWWDAGIFLTGTVPVPFIGEEAKAILDVAMLNGPGDAHQTTKLVDLMKPNANGYMYENFMAKGRQPWDNNRNKYIPVRLAVKPTSKLEVGASYASGKYDFDEQYGAAFAFAHALYGGDKLTVAAEYGQLKVDVKPANMMTAANAANGTTGDGSVTQYSYYLSAGYKVLQDKFVHYVEPVVRYEVMDSWAEDDLNKNDRQVVWAGVRCAPYKYWTLKAGYGWQMENSGYALDNDGFILESVLEF
ncbi:MAG: hypothetical protein A2219_01520 [Elusimicrobia bacterium RIFOXYA2_FULL_50_26]|nr:MAG: hypothetical protein A2219_01520 [Elusimicrobia bacterium RIFOXYA2_FULL_50_26]